uniref:UDP-N-acetylglucosamine 2-epimerase (non-hydrolyzing) n=1 Tax=candidate division WOR-3 bacterium TaxID=2052148 RepID=A0A7V3V0C8_UNCW3
MRRRYKILISFGTRPEAIKLGPVVKELQRYPDRFQVVVVATAQHREMLDQVLNIFDIVPNYDLQIMAKNQSLSYVVVKILTRLEPVLKKEKPDILLVQGDASSAFASALAAYYQKIPIGHVEAGLRTYDKYSPFPEEINRRFIALIADIHFAPTRLAFQNLIAEGVDKERIHISGNTVIDALQWILKKTKYSLQQGKNTKILLVTLHRRENFGSLLRGICEALLTIVRRHPDVEVVFPVHPNPNVRKTVSSILSGEKRLRLLPPLNYPEFVGLMKQAYLILTDSGGIQEEAPTLGKPVLVLREKTERPEAIKFGTALLVGTKPEQIITVTERILSSKRFYQRMVRNVNVYGDGKAALRIRRILSQWLASVDSGHNFLKLCS